MKKQLTTSLQEAQRVNEIIRSCSDFKAALKRVASNAWEYEEDEIHRKFDVPFRPYVYEDSGSRNL
jgi:hypothetical protein